MLEVRSLKKVYHGRMGGIEALRGVEFRVGQGEIVGLFGEKGA